MEMGRISIVITICVLWSLIIEAIAVIIIELVTAVRLVVTLLFHFIAAWLISTEVEHTVGPDGVREQDGDDEGE